MNKFRHGPEISESRQFRLEFGGVDKLAADVQKAVINQICRAGAENYYGSRITCPERLGPPSPEPAPTPMRAPTVTRSRGNTTQSTPTSTTGTTARVTPPPASASTPQPHVEPGPAVILGPPGDDGQEHLQEARRHAAEGRYGPARAALQRAQAQGWNDMDLVDLLSRESPEATAEAK